MAKKEEKIEKNKKTSGVKKTNNKKTTIKEIELDTKPKTEMVEIKKDKNISVNKTIIASIICLVVGVVGGILVGKQLNKKDPEVEKEIVTEIEEKIETVYSCEFNKDNAIVTFNDEEMISNLQLFESLKSDYALKSLIDMIDKKILEEKYPDELKNAKSEAASTMKELKNNYGDELEQAIQYYTGYATADAYENYLYIAYLQDLAINDYAKSQITEKDIKKYYDEEIVGDIKIRHILITPKTSSDMTDSEISAATKEAQEKVEAIIAELGKTDKNNLEDKFIELAKEQSEDKATKNNGGSLGFINKDTLSEYYENVVNAAYSLKDGEYSTKVIETAMGYHVILRTESKEKESLENIKEQIIETLVMNYINNNSVAVINSMDSLRKDAGMKFNDKDLEKKYQEYIQELIKAYSQK